ncbi:unnamed protein product [Candida verbasci]|uniref:Enhancer of polycomb-like protein n=1 Tax=Candida verbasci TaxID=1227364 RepID=A0A9W4TP05_9ASCO|nr:unnamed protein product [Candida verbasci]
MSVRFRQRKISVKQNLHIYKQTELNSNDLELSQINHLDTRKDDINSIEAGVEGVDKTEQDEIHLQQVINAAQKFLSSKKTEAQLFIPTPDASRIWDDAKNYYQQDFKESKSYICYGFTYESLSYCMDEEDEEFFKSLIKPKKKKEDAISELEFEIIIEHFEKVIETKQPFLSMDPTNILSYEEISTYIIDQYKSSVKSTKPYIELSSGILNYIPTNTLKERLGKELNFQNFTTIFDKETKETPRSILKLLDLFGKSVYEHWKKRKIERNGKSIQPSLKFEDPNANEKDNDNDPYVCFRRREFRQVRKTRRADTLGAERIRLLQKSLQKARELVLNVSEREILKAKTFQSERELFKLRCEGKSLKRSLNLKENDDHLYFAYKRRKIIKPKEDEEEKKVKEKKKEERQQQQQQPPPQSQTEGTSTNQPYVKLPPSKIPDMDLVTVSLVLKEKNDTIRRAVSEKLRKRKEQDKGFINLTDDPYEPIFDISTNQHIQEISHIPYSSIAATNFYQFNTSNYIGDPLKKLIEDDHSLPGVKSIKGSNGELIPNKAFPHLSSITENNQPKSYIELLLENVENNYYNNYTSGYTHGIKEETKISDPIFRLRKRQGRAGTFIDRRGIIKPIELNESDDSQFSHENKFDQLKRLESNWRFDDDLSEYQKGSIDPFSLDPSKLNSISDETQAIRFGSMLLSKSYGLLKESVQQKQQMYLQQARMRALHNQQAQKQHQQQQQQQQQIQKKPTPQPPQKLQSQFKKTSQSPV